MSKIINIGIIGCGHWGPNYVRVLNASPSAIVKVVYDLDEIEELLDRLEAFVVETGRENMEEIEKFVHEIGLPRFVPWESIVIFIKSVI